MQVYEYMITSVINEKNYPELLKIMLDPDLEKLTITDKRLEILSTNIKILNLITVDDDKIKHLKQFIKFLNLLKEEKEPPSKKRKLDK